MNTTTTKIKFHDYEKYPAHIMSACHFRDEYDELPDGAFWAIADEYNMTDLLIELAEWEDVNTDVSS